MRAIDVMTRPVVTVSPEAGIDAAVRLLLGHRISALPVVDDDGRLVGIVSEGDLLRRLGHGGPHRRWRELFRPASQPAADGIATHGKRVRDVMTRDTVAVEELTGVADIVDLLQSRRIRRVPVVRDGRPVGIVSRADLLPVLASAAAAAIADPDRAVRERLLGELRRRPWAHVGEANIVVSDGVVHLWRSVGSEDMRTALLVLAENIEGVRAVEDHMTPRGHYLI